MKSFIVLLQVVLLCIYYPASVAGSGRSGSVRGRGFDEDQEVLLVENLKSHLLEEDDQDVSSSSDHHRGLLNVCNGPTETYYFEVNIRLIPDATTITGVCETADQVMLGHDLNQLLLDFGIGDSGVDLDVITAFLAGVCPSPSTSSTSTSRKRELAYLAINGFMWKGGGGCRLCLYDNADNRALSTTGGNWFDDVFAPDMEQALEAGIESRVVPSHTNCLGTAPVVEVTLTQVSLSDLDLTCEDGRVIQTLHSLSLMDVPLMKQNCGSCHRVDFSTAGDETVLTKGTWVLEQFKPKYGLTVTASGGHSPLLQARILDTGDVECPDVAVDGTLDFGSPNQQCEGGGTGEGFAGAAGRGVNCRAVGNALVVQQPNQECPSASIDGGSITFAWSKPVMFADIGLMDIDENNQRIRIHYADGFFEIFSYVGFGDNAVQRVVAGRHNVVKVEVIFTGTGAVTEINFCPECQALTTLVPDEESCLYTEDNAFINAHEVVYFDNFEEAQTSVTAWQNGQIATRDGLSRFMGEFTKDKASPYKVFSVSRTSDGIIFDFDLYELDLEGYVKMFVDGERLEIGEFGPLLDEGTRKGNSTLGVSWVLTGIDTLAQDQRHHVHIIVPKSTGLLADGTVRLALSVVGIGPSESEWVGAIGYDNFRISRARDCSLGNEATPRSVPIGAFALKTGAAGMCVKVDDSSMEKNVLQFNCGGTPNDEWEVLPVVGGGFQLRNPETAKCMSVAGASSNDAANVILQHCVEGPNQILNWVGNALKFQHSSKCLDVAGPSTSAGANIYQSACANTWSQRFLRSYPVPDPAPSTDNTPTPAPDPPVSAPTTAPWQQAAHGWRILTPADSSKRANVFDVNRLEFHTSTDCSGTPLAVSEENIIASRTSHMAGHRPGHAFIDIDEYLWGGRPDSEGNFFIGSTFDRKYDVRCVRLISPDVRDVSIQSLERGTWNTVWTERNIASTNSNDYLITVGATGWRVIVDDDGLAMADIQYLAFYPTEDCSGLPLASNKGTYSDSGNAGPGYTPDHAFSDNSYLWGGRPDANGDLWLGKTFRRPVAVSCVELRTKFFRRFSVQAYENGRWTSIYANAKAKENLQTTLLPLWNLQPNGWRVLADSTAHGAIWADVNRLEFHTSTDCSGTPLTVDFDNIIDSGDAGVFGWDAKNAFINNDVYAWGGRPDADGNYWIGSTFDEAHAVKCVTLVSQSLQDVSIQSLQGGAWKTVWTVRGIDVSNSHNLLPVGATGWRIWADSTEAVQQDKVDVQYLGFYPTDDCSGPAIKGLSTLGIDSNNVGDGYTPMHAFIEDDDRFYWGGRPDVAGNFWLGQQFYFPQAVGCVEVQTSSLTRFSVQAYSNGGWSNLLANVRVQGLPAATVVPIVNSKPKGWRIWAPGSSSKRGDLLDVIRLEFYTSVTCGGTPLEVQYENVIDSGDPGVVGWDGKNAFIDNDAYRWGGRRDSEGNFWLGSTFDEGHDVRCVRFISSDFNDVSIQSLEGGTWNTVWTQRNIAPLSSNDHRITLGATGWRIVVDDDSLALADVQYLGFYASNDCSGLALAGHDDVAIDSGNAGPTYEPKQAFIEEDMLYKWSGRPDADGNLWLGKMFRTPQVIRCVEVRTYSFSKVSVQMNLNGVWSTVISKTNLKQIPEANLLPLHG